MRRANLSYTQIFNCEGGRSPSPHWVSTVNLEGDRKRPERWAMGEGQALIIWILFQCDGKPLEGLNNRETGLREASKRSII